MLPAWDTETEMTLTLPEGENVYYTFVPESTGRYLLRSGCQEHDHVYDVYIDSAEGIVSPGNWVTGNSYEIVAGQRYYIREAYQERETESYTLTLQPAYTVTDIKVMELDSEYIADMDSYIGDNAKLQITYSNGKSEELVFGRGETYVFDNYGNDFQYHVVQGSGEDEVTFSPWDTLSAGEYQIVFEHNEPNGRIYTSVPVAVKNINEFEFTKLSETSGLGIVLAGNESMIYSFTPEFDGEYQIGWSGNASIYTEFYRNTESGIDRVGTWDTYITVDNLIKGETYYVRFTNENESSVNLKLEAAYRPGVEKVELVKKPEKNIRVKGLENTSFDSSDFRVKMIYTNGATDTRFLYENDIYNHYVTSEIYEVAEDGTENYVSDSGDLPVGNYVQRIICGSAWVDFEFRVISVDEAAYGEISANQGETAVENNTEARIYKVVIQEPGTYKYQSNVPVNLSVLNAEGSDVSVFYETEYEKCMKLEASTYYFRVDAKPSYYPSFAFEFEKVTDIESVDIQLANTEYTVLDVFDLANISVAVHYADGTTYTTKLSSGNGAVEGRDGRMIHFYMQNDAGSEHVQWEELRNPGTYTIVARLNGESYNLGESEEMHVSELDTGNFRTIQTDEMVVPGNQEEDFLFVPAEDSVYQLKDEWGDALGYSIDEICIYTYQEDSKNMIRIDMDEMLTAGRTYVIRLKGLNETKFKIVKSDGGSSGSGMPEGANRGVLEIGKEELVYLDDVIEYVDYTYTPSESGMYILESNGDYDTVVALYKGNDESQIASDDDGSDSGNNFKLAYYMTAGQTYRYRVRMYSGMSGSRQFSILLTHPEYKAIKSAEVLKTQEEFKPGPSLTDDIWQSMKWKLTYEDGTTTEFMASGYNSQSDAYGNKILWGYESPHPADSITGSFYYQNITDDYDNLVAELNFKILSLESLSKPYVPGDTVTVESDTEGYYQFKVEKDGVYRLDRQITGYNYSLQILDESANEVYQDYEYSTWDKTYYTLEAGRNYYLRISCGKDTKVSAALQAERLIKDIKIEAPKESLVMYKNIDDSPDFSGWKLSIQYEDGGQETLLCEESNEVSFTGQYLHDTSYRCYVTYKKHRAFLDIEVRNPNTLEALQVGVTKNVTVNGRTYYRFTPSESGYYHISDTGSLGDHWSVKVLNEDGETLSMSFCRMLKGQNYYIVVEAHLENPNVGITIKNAKEERDIQLYVDYPVRVPLIANNFSSIGWDFGRLQAVAKDNTICTAHVLQSDNANTMVEVSGITGGSTQIDIVDIENDIVLASYNINVSSLPDDAIVIKDIGLKSYLLNQVFWNWNQSYISKDMMESLTSLYLDAWSESYRIYDLSGLEYAKNLKVLSLHNQDGITDISVVKQLTLLDTFDLRGTSVSSEERWELADFENATIYVGDRVILPSMRYLFEEGLEVKVISGNDKAVLAEEDSHYSLTGLKAGTVKLEITYDTFRKEIEVQILDLGKIEDAGEPFDGTAEIEGITDYITMTESDMKILDSNGNLWVTYPEAKKESENVKKYVADVVYQLTDNGIKHNDVELILDNNGALFKNGVLVAENVVEFTAEYALKSNGELIDLIYGDIEPMKDVVSWESDMTGNGRMLLSDGRLIERSILIEGGKSIVTDSVIAENVRDILSEGYIDSDNNLCYMYETGKILATNVQSFTEVRSLMSYYGTDGNLYLRDMDGVYINVGRYKLKDSEWVNRLDCTMELMDNGELYKFDSVRGEMTLFDTGAESIQSESYTKQDGTYWDYEKNQVGTSADNPLVVKYVCSPKDVYALQRTTSDKDCIVIKNNAVEVMNSVIDIWNDHGIVYVLRTDGSVWKLNSGTPEKVLSLKQKLELEAIKDLNASALDERQVRLTWSPIDKAEGYLIYRRIPGESTKYLSIVKGTSYTDIMAVTGETNYYRVYPYYMDADGKRVLGSAGNEASAKPTLASVQNLRAVSAGKNCVKLNWDAVSGASGYLVYGQKDGKYSYVGMTTLGTTFTDRKALDSDYNFYWVFAYVKDETGKMRTGACEKYAFAKGICPAVTNLRASSMTGSVRLTWTASAGAEGYLIYGMNGANSNYHYIGMTTRGTAFTDVKASKSEWNFYWVFPYHKNAEGKMITGGTAKYVFGKAK